MIGKLRKRITILKTTYTPDGIGGQIPSQIADKVLWCESTMLEGYRAEQFRHIHNGQPVEFVIRTKSYPITTENIIEWDNIQYTIHSIITDPIKKLTTIIAHK